MGLHTGGPVIVAIFGIFAGSSARRLRRLSSYVKWMRALRQALMSFVRSMILGPPSTSGASPPNNVLPTYEVGEEVV